MARSDRWPRAFFCVAAGAALFAVAAGCDGQVHWDSRAVATPTSGSWDSVEIRVHGSRTRDHDLGEACNGTVVVMEKGVRRTLKLDVNGNLFGTLTGPAGPLPPGTLLDAAELRSIFPALSPAEAEDVLSLLWQGCAGPKAGFQPVKNLIVKVAEQRYR